MPSMAEGIDDPSNPGAAVVDRVVTVFEGDFWREEEEAEEDDDDEEETSRISTTPSMTQASTRVPIAWRFIVVQANQILQSLPQTRSLPPQNRQAN